MAKASATELAVFKDRAARANTAIFEILAKESPQTIKQLLKQVARYPGLEETYYTSLTKRLHALREAGYIKENKTTQEDTRAQTSCELKPKAYLAMLLKEKRHAKHTLQSNRHAGSLNPAITVKRAAVRKRPKH